MTKIKLEPEFRAKWLEALRSPDWEGRETYRALCDGEGSFCALGLAAQVHGVPLNPDDQAVAYEWLEKQGGDPRKSDPDEDDWFERAYRAFDLGQRMTFPEFADWLEANSEPRE